MKPKWQCRVFSFSLAICPLFLSLSEGSNYPFFLSDQLIFISERGSEFASFHQGKHVFEAFSTPPGCVIKQTLGFSPSSLNCWHGSTWGSQIRDGKAKDYIICGPFLADFSFPVELVVSPKQDANCFNTEWNDRNCLLQTGYWFAWPKLLSC